MPYTFRNIAVEGAFATELTGINNADEVAGSYATVSSAIASQLPFTEIGGVFSFAADGTFPRAREYTGGINNAGAVAVTSGGGTTTPVGVVWSPTAAPSVISQTGAFVHAIGISDDGTVVGWISPQSSLTSGFVFHAGTLDTFQVGGTRTEAHGINNAGVIVGVIDPNGDAAYQGFIDDHGTIATLNVPGAIATDPMAINAAGKVAGSYYDGTHWHGFIDTAGQMTFINAPDAADTWVTGINDADHISGYFASGDVQQTTGFVAVDPPSDPAEMIVRENYLAAFARDAEPGGLSGWAGALRGGMTPQQLANDLAGSAEFAADHGQQSDAEYIDSLYVNALGRHAEPGGIAGWAGALQAGASRGDVMAAIAQSSEGQQHFEALHG